MFDQNQGNPFLGGQTQAEPQMANPFAGVPTADVYGGGTYLNEGAYVVELGELVSRMSDNGKGQLFIINCTVQEAHGDGATPEGSKGSQVIAFRHQSAEGNCKQFFLAAFKALAEKQGRDPEAVTDGAMKANPQQFAAAMGAAIGPDQPCAGLTLGLQVTQVPTRSGGVFSKHVWAYLPGRGQAVPF